MNHMATNRVHRTGIRAHHNGPHGKGGGRQHHSLPCNNAIYGYKFGLDDFLKIGNLVL
jgi:hypothetical protein